MSVQGGCRALKRQIDHVESSIVATVQEVRLSFKTIQMGAYPERSFSTVSINLGFGFVNLSST